MAISSTARKRDNGQIPIGQLALNRTLPIARVLPIFALLFFANRLASQSPEPTLLPDLAIHSVDPGRVMFDNFDGSYTSLTKTSPTSILKLRDWIRPLYKPRFELAETVRWLNPGDRIIVYLGEDGAKVYPLKILEYHEIINDVVDGRPILVTYCPLCVSGVVFERRIAGKAVYFGNTSALYESNMVMYDYETLSYWVQVSGEAITGKATGQKLTLLPSMTLTWRQCAAAYSPPGMKRDRC
jgi:hypothetical protein